MGPRTLDFRAQDRLLNNPQSPHHQPRRVMNTRPLAAPSSRWDFLQTSALATDSLLLIRAASRVTHYPPARRFIGPGYDYRPVWGG